MEDRRRLNRRAGFSLVELIIVIAIMAVLSGLITASYIGYMERAKKARALTNAKAIFDAAQIAIIDASTYENEAFRYALKFEETIDGETVRLGRFSNQSLYKYLQESGGGGSLSSALSKAADYRIAESLSGSIKGADGNIESDLLQDKSPIGDTNSTKYISEHPETYGEVVFAMAYNAYGELVYFQCVYDKYFMTWEQGSGFTAERVSDSTRFNNWPRTRASGTDGW
ncbi:MAG: type II secretion system GspH family protein [Clostridium sp.]|nr:type II secretion system GspH family protein [Acetatifactor muris]MCM1526852.1 type II secretion system GspH family protein [Bacteroides sp.]MCM1562948.1 type II secretion system GspH family protein [Clostridium sp.]